MISSIRQNSLFKDSFWAIIGNGLSNAMMLASGILIARLLGKDLYGEYGIVKSTMVYAANFASFGLSVTSTKYVVQAIKEHPDCILSTIRNILRSAICFSIIVAVLILSLAKPLAAYLGSEELAMPLRVMAIMMIARSVNFTATGIIAGLGEFRKMAINNVISGIYMVLVCFPLTKAFSLNGALFALLSYQVANSSLNLLSIRNATRNLSGQIKNNNYREILFSSFPIALRDSSFVICNWVAILMLTKMSSMGELGIYTASTQWNAIITCIPALLNNVVLSHLSSSYDDVKKNKRTVFTMLAVYLSCTGFLFILVALFSSQIASLYGNSFAQMIPVLRIIIFATIPDCCSEVFQSEFVALGKNWFLFISRLVKDSTRMICVFLLLRNFNGVNGAYYFGIASLAASWAYFFVLLISFLITQKKRLLTLPTPSRSARCPLR